MRNVFRQKLVTQPGWRVSCKGFANDDLSNMRTIGSAVSLVINGKVSASLANAISEFGIQELMLTECEIAVDDLIAATSQESLESLTLEAMDISPLVLQALSLSLKKLLMVGCRINLAGLSCLERLGQLDTLNVSLCSFYGKPLGKVRLQNVRVVDFSGSEMSDAVTSMFQFGSSLELASFVHAKVSSVALETFISDYPHVEVS